MSEGILKINFDDYIEKKNNLSNKKDNIYLDVNSELNTGVLISNVVDEYAKNYTRIKNIMDMYVQLLEKDIELMSLTKEAYEEMERKNVEFIEKSKWKQGDK